MIRQAFATFFFLILIVVLTFEVALAGFGITPPYVRNTSLTRNSVYEQQILLVRSDPREALKAEIQVDAPEIADWITIVEGDEFVLPAGEQKIPMTVRVQVPDDVDFKNYGGIIIIKTSPVDGGRAGAVNISLGAQVDIDLNVIDREIFDFRVRRVDMSAVEEGHKLGWLYFPGKIRFDMFIENTGNVDVAPTAVKFRIYDITGNVLLEETENTNRIRKIPPFGTETVTAELPTRLPPGNYIARYTIYNQDEENQSGQISLGIAEYGTLQVAGYGFLGLSFAHKVSVILPVLTLLGIFGLIFWSHRRKRRSTSSHA